MYVINYISSTDFNVLLIICFQLSKIKKKIKHKLS
jgi:hypothetical protein